MVQISAAILDDLWEAPQSKLLHNLTDIQRTVTKKLFYSVQIMR
jgi:hypothetical protein